MRTERPLGWGLIGASDIARTRMIEAIRAQPNSNVVAVMSSQIARARSYAAKTTGRAARGNDTCDMRSVLALFLRRAPVGRRRRVAAYLIADTSAIVLPTSNAHHAQRSPWRKAVTAMALAISPNTTL